MMVRIVMVFFLMVTVTFLRVLRTIQRGIKISR